MTGRPEMAAMIYYDALALEVVGRRLQDALDNLATMSADSTIRSA